MTNPAQARQDPPASPPCNRHRPATMPSAARFGVFVSALAAVAALLVASTPASAQGMCPGQPLCRDAGKFSATITEFRVSPNTTGNRPVYVTVRFTNKAAQPLTLGYVDGTAAAYDDRGNKYQLQNTQTLQGMGRIERHRFDPKFTLGPGESSDARLEVNFYARSVIVGTEFDFEMSVREIDPVPGNQYRLGREHALSWQHLKSGVRGSAPPAASAPAQAVVAGATGAPAQAGSPIAAADPCLGVPNCAASGQVLAKIVGATPSTKGTNHHLMIRIAFQNVGSTPLIINYKQDTGKAVDERGGEYVVDSRDRNSVQGIPISTRDRASSQFTLQPGESRTAAFDFRRYTGTVPAGTRLNPSIAVEQYELLPSNQLRLEREHALSFGELGGGAGALPSSAGASAATVSGEPADAVKALRDLRDLFKKL
jgi:hypothetical protein